VPHFWPLLPEVGISHNSKTGRPEINPFYAAHQLFRLDAPVSPALFFPVPKSVETSHFNFP
jgi:hypothetical protein